MSPPSDVSLNNSLKITRPQVTLREMVLEKLRSAILDFTLKPGERLVERDLCARLGVSRTSVREALRSLQAEGLVEQGEGRGPRVSIIALSDARDIYELRCSLEGMVMHLFTQKASAVHMAQLDAAWELLKETLRAQETAPIVEAVSNFYDVLYKGAGNHVAGLMIPQLQARLNSLRATTVSQPGRYIESFREMARIVEALKARNSVAAYEACIEHILKASEIGLTLLAKRENQKDVPVITRPLAVEHFQTSETLS